MTAQQAGQQMTKALGTLKPVRDELGAELSRSRVQPDVTNPQTRQISELHDRVVTAISACFRGV